MCFCCCCLRIMSTQVFSDKTMVFLDVPFKLEKEECLMTSGRLLYVVSWAVDESGFPMAPTAPPHRPSSTRWVWTTPDWLPQGWPSSHTHAHAHTHTPLFVCYLMSWRLFFMLSCNRNTNHVTLPVDPWPAVPMQVGLNGSGTFSLTPTTLLTQNSQNSLGWVLTP